MTEDEQYALYRSLIDRVAPQPVTIRTFDLDERQVGHQASRLERRRTRPGLRGLRLGLANPDCCGRSCAPWFAPRRMVRCA